MNKKKLTIITTALALTLAFAALASAYGNRGFSQAYDKLTPEKQEVVRGIFTKHSDSLTALRNDTWAKNLELEALTNSGKATKADIESLVHEISALRLKMQKERQAMFAEIETETGVQFQPGMGYGNGDCPGYGGRGMRGGHGMHNGNGGYGMRGDCPRY